MGLDDPADLPSDDRARYHLLVEWWTKLENADDCWRTTREVLFRLRDQVNALLESRPMRLDEAEQATADAIWQFTGFGETD